MIRTVLRELVAAVGLDFDAKAFDKAEVGLKNIKNIAIGLGTLLVASKVTQGFKNIVVGAAEAADSADETAQSIGTTASALQGLSHAATLNGASQQELVVGLSQISRKALDASKGSKEAAAGFNRLGVKLKDSNGRLRSSDDLFLDVADAMQKVQSPTERTALAMDMFGRSGARLIPTLLKGRKGIEDTAAEVDELGASFDEAFVRESSLFTDNMARVQLVLQGLQNIIARAVLPFLNRTVDAFIRWRKANKEVISDRLTSWAEGLLAVIRKLYDFGTAIGRVFMDIASVLPGLSEQAWILVGAAIALAVALGLPALVLAALAAAFVLAYDDVKAFFEGGDSLIGRVIERWDSWVESVVANNNVLGFLIYLLDKVGEAVAFVAAVFTGDWETVKVILDDVAGALKVVWEAWSKFASFDGAIEGIMSWVENSQEQNARRFAAPQPSAIAAGMASGANSSGQFNAEITVNSSPGQDPREVAVAARQEFDDWYQSTLNDAGAALTPEMP